MQARSPEGRGQARPAALALLALLAPGCARVPDDVNLALMWRRVSGALDAGRTPPPGLAAAYPNLASVPPRPARPDAATRGAVSDALAAERERSRRPAAAGAGPARALAASPGEPPIPAAPPPPPRLAGAPRVPWGGAAPAGTSEPAAPVPSGVPPPPPPDLLGPPPAPLL